MNESIGVFYVPFQTAEVPDLHGHALSMLLNDYQHVVVALPVRRVTPTKNAPLDYAAREAMIRHYNGNISHYVHVVPVVDKKYPKDKVAALESAVKSLFSNFPGPVTLFTDSAFDNLYNENGGAWKVRVDAYLEVEQNQRYKVLHSANVADVNFRRGVISGMMNQFPISWPTVDMAIRREVVVDREAPPHTKVLYLFGKKPGENGWRFPGGFKDRSDPNFETAVLREGGEEVLKKDVKPEDVFERPHYISSRNVKDWRYKGEPDGITTLFFQLNFIGTEDQIKAGDDLCDAQWFCLEDMNPETIEGEHIYLYEDLCKYEDARKGSVEI
jgi:NUDIX domain